MWNAKIDEPRHPNQTLALLAAFGLGLLCLAGPLRSSPAVAGLFGLELSAPEVADILYARYRVARVMSVITVGDVYQADAIDRRGYRVRFIVDGDNGAVLDSFVIGRAAYEAPVPIPPGLVPAMPGVRIAPSPPPPGRLAPPEPAKPAPRTRQVRTPEAGSTADEPAGIKPDAPAKPAAPLRSPPASTQQEKMPPATASRPNEPASLAPPVKPTVVPPPAAEPAAKPPQARDPSEARQALPAARTPEPLIDPRTGKATGSVPVAPLDDARPAAGAQKPITIVPPAALD